MAVFLSTMGRVNGMAGRLGGSVLEHLALRNEAWPRSWVPGTLEFLSVEDPKTNEAHCSPRDDGLKTKEYPDSE